MSGSYEWVRFAQSEESRIYLKDLGGAKKLVLLRAPFFKVFRTQRISTAAYDVHTIEIFLTITLYIQMLYFSIYSR